MPQPIMRPLLGAGSGFTPRLRNDLFRITGNVMSNHRGAGQLIARRRY